MHTELWIDALPVFSYCSFKLWIGALALLPPKGCIYLPPKQVQETGRLVPYEFILLPVV